MTTSNDGKNGLEKVDPKNITPHFTPRISVSGGKVFRSAQLTYRKLPIKKSCTTDLKQLSFGFCGNATKSPRLPLIRLLYQVHQRKISFRRMCKREVTSALIPLTEPEIILLTIEFLPYHLIIFPSTWLTLDIHLHTHAPPMIWIHQILFLISWNYALNYMLELLMFKHSQTER